MNWALLQNSLLVAAATALLATIIGFAAAVFAATLSRRWQWIALTLAVIALVMPPFLVTNSWLDWLGTNGLLHRWIPLNIFSLSGAVLILTLLLWPVPFFLTWSAARKIERAHLEVDLALRGFALLRWLLWPATKHALAIGAAIVFVLALNNFAVPTILQVKIFPAEVWVNYNTTLNTGAAFRTGLPMIITPLLLLSFAGTRRIDWPRRSVNDCSRSLRIQLGSIVTMCSAVIAVSVLLLSIVAPLVQLTISSRTWSEFTPAFTAGTRALANSFVYGFGSAVITLLIGLAAWRARAVGFMWLVFLVPGVLLGTLLTLGFNRPGLAWFYRSAAVVIFAFAMRYLALAWSAARGARMSVDQNIIDALRLEGARGLKLFRHAVWPQIAPQLLLAGYVVYLLCLWDVETIVTIVPPGGETLALRIFNLLHYGHNSHVNTLCVLLLIIAVLPLVLWGIVRAFSSRRRIAEVFGATIAGLLLTACSATDEKPSTPIQSKLFSSVEVIGGRGTAAGQFNKPRSVAVDTNDNLFVIDMTGRVQKFSPEGKFLLSWEMPQTDLGKPKGLCRDRNGNIVVLEPHYQRVNFFTPGGKLVAQWGRRGTNAGEFMLPRDVAVNSKSEVIVPEYMDSERVQRFSARGDLLAIIGKPGLGNGEFNRAEGIAVDTSDRIYVADSCNHRIQIFSSDGKFIRAYGKSGAATGDISYPYDICVDGEGRQYVCEFGNSRVQVFDANDRSIDVIGKPGGAPGEFNNPWGVALDSKGNLYVADAMNHRVQKLVRRKVISESVISKQYSIAARAVATGLISVSLITDYLSPREVRR